MSALNVVPIRDLEDCQRALERVQARIDAVSPDKLSAMNVDLLAATAIAIGVAHVILAMRESIAVLPNFDISNVNNLPDYAKATWFLVITNFPNAEAPDQMEQEVLPLRNKLLTWAQPLAQSGHFNQAAIDKIREGYGIRDAAGDLVALATLYRSVWGVVRGICAITEADLQRASEIGPAVYAAACRRENGPTLSPPEATLRIRKAWTLLDTAYAQCRRAVAYLRHAEDDVDTLVPNLRRNPGPKRSQSAEREETPLPTKAPAPQATAAVAEAEPPIGDGQGPFIENR